MSLSHGVFPCVESYTGMYGVYGCHGEGDTRWYANGCMMTMDQQGGSYVKCDHRQEISFRQGCKPSYYIPRRLERLDMGHI